MTCALLGMTDGGAAERHGDQCAKYSSLQLVLYSENKNIIITSVGYSLMYKIRHCSSIQPAIWMKDCTVADLQ